MTKANARSLSELDRLDDFLDEDGIREAVEARAVKRVIALQLQEAMKARNLTRAEMAELMDTSRAQLNRVLNPDTFNVTLETLSKAAHIVGRKLRVELA
jgi:predicted XRE-type DNA-binding protein